MSKPEDLCPHCGAPQGVSGSGSLVLAATCEDYVPRDERDDLGEAGA